MKILRTKELNASQLQQIDQLWNDAYPIKLSNRFRLLLEGVNNYNHYLIEENNQVIAWAVAFDKDNETRFSIIVQKNFQGKGLGKALINKLKVEVGEFNGWVIDHNNDLKQDGTYYKSPLNFYLKNGFELVPKERIDSEMIKAVKVRNKITIIATTERLILREILPKDLDSMFELDSNPEVHKYLGNTPVTDRQQIVEVIQYIRQQYIDHGIGRWAMIDKKTNAFIGWTGLKFVTQEINQHKNFYDLGYRLMEQYWGQGLGTESAIASLKYAFDQLNAQEVYAFADCQNEGSNNILSKIGFQLIESFDFENTAHNWYKMDRATFLNQTSIN